VDCDLPHGDILTPHDLRQLARQLWEASDDSQEALAAHIERDQSAVSRALGDSEDTKTRYAKTCVRIIEHYCPEVMIHYPRGQVERSS